MNDDETILGIICDWQQIFTQ